MYSLKKIEAKNFKSFLGFTMDIQEGIFLVKGENEDDGGMESNGSGKSSIFDAVLWCLTGGTLNKSRGRASSVDDVVNLKKGKDCFVKTYWDLNGSEAEITRYQNHTEYGNTIQVILDGQSITSNRIADTQERLDQLIPLNYDMLKSTILMSQNLHNRFSEMTPNERVSMLEQVRDYSLWDKVRREAKNNLDDIKSSVRENEDEINKNRGIIEHSEGLVVRKKESLKEYSEKEIDTSAIEVYRDKIDKLGGKKKSTNLELSDLDKSDEENNAKIKDLEVEEEDKKKLIREKYEQDKENLSIARKNRDSAKEKVSEEENKQKEYDYNISKLENQIKQDEETIKSVEHDIDNYKEILDDPESTCPTCGQGITSQEHKDNIQGKIKNFEQTKIEKKKNIENNKSEISEQKKLVEECKISIEFWKDKVEMEGETVEEFEQILNNTNEDLLKISEVYSEKKKPYLGQISENSSKRSQLRDYLHNFDLKISDYENRIKEIEIEVSNRETTIKNFKEEIKSLKLEIKESKDLIEKLSDNNEKLRKESNKFNFFWDELGPKGNLRPYLISKDVKFLNKALRHYSDKFYDCVDIVLSEPDFENRAIDISILQKNTQTVKVASQLSAGERKRLDLAIQFSIYDLIKSTSNLDINILVLDEIFDGLDGVGVFRAVEVIQERQTHIPSIYVISHNPYLQSMILDHIIVTKNNENSKLSLP